MRLSKSDATYATGNKLIINRVFGKLSHATFTIKPIREFVMRYVGDGKLWFDPFAGANSPAESTNDWNPEMPTDLHLPAEEAVKLVEGPLRGVIFDPPYSYRQVTEHYKAVGRKATQRDTSYNFYRRVMEPLAEEIEIGGYALSFGWNSNGFGKSLGFEKVEILLVGHGGHHNDTICLAERKIL
jgi:hypothetical protein